MSTHTPWRCTCTISNRSGAHQYEGERWQRIEHCPLHVAAPELMEALEAAVKALENIPTSWGAAFEVDKARAAIAKAKGENNG